MPVRTFSLVEVTLTERRRLERPLLALVWVGVASFSVAVGNLLYLLMGTVAVGANLLAASRGKEIFIRRGFVNLAVVLATGVLVVELLVGRTSELQAISHYLVLIQLCKLFEQKRNRDYVQMLAMSMLLVMVATLLSDAMWMAAVLVGYLALTCWTMTIFTLKRGLDDAANQRLAMEPAPLAPQQVAWNVLRNWPERPLRRFVVSGAGTMVLGGVLAFLLVPRSEGSDLPMLGMSPGRRSSSISGIGGEVQLGRPTQVQLSARTVMRVEMTLDGTPVTATGPAAYLRGHVFDVYSGNSWQRSWALERDIPEHKEMMEPLHYSHGGVLVQRITMGSDLLPVLFSVYPTIAVDVPTRVNRGLSRTVPAREERGGEWVLYVARSWPQQLSDHRLALLRDLDARLEEMDSLAPAYQRRPRPEGIEVAPRVAELARRWTQDLLEQRHEHPESRDECDMAIVARLSGRLQEHCEYSLDLRDADSSRDGVEDFLFNMRKGHCEYFASALTVMCHSLGITARLATGFHLNDPPRDGVHLVRERDAHAWTEIHTPSNGWVIFDATPVDERHVELSAFDRLRDWWEAVNLRWYEVVGSYDGSNRQRLLKSVKDSLSAAARHVAEAAKAAAIRLKEGVVDLFVRRTVDKVILGIALVTAAVGLVAEAMLIRRAIRRRNRLPWMEDAPPVPARQFEFATRLFAILTRHGCRTRSSQTDREVVDQAIEQLHLPRGPLERLVRLYHRMRWGGKPASREELQEARITVAEIHKALSDRP